MDVLDAWAERQAIEDRDDLAHLAAEYESRRRPPPGEDPFTNGHLTNVPVALGSASWLDAAPIEGPRLGLTRDVISTPSRYLVASARVDSCFGIYLADLWREHDAALWRGRSGLAQSDGIRRKIEALARRRHSMQECVRGHLAVPVYRCGSCGELQTGVADSCNHRCCPRCVSKLRLQNQAKVHAILEHVDEQRRRQGRRVPRWRFATLTLPSLPAFAASRRYLGATWGRLLRTRFWTCGEQTAVAAFETTHTKAGWHVHLHVIVDRFLPRYMLVRRWQECALRTLVEDAENARAILRPGNARTWGAPCSSAALGVLRAILDEARRRGMRHDYSEVQTFAPALLADLSRDRDRATRVVMRRQVRQVLALLPTGAGQHVSESKGSRADMIRELSKYMAKDLGVGSGVDHAHGVFGTEAHGVEFLRGIWRWRTLRTYGDALGANLRALERPMVCDHCGHVGLEYHSRRWQTMQQIDESERERGRRRALARGNQQRPPAEFTRTDPDAKIEPPKRTRVDPDAKLHSLLHYCEMVACETRRQAALRRQAEREQRRGTRTGDSTSCCNGSDGASAHAARRRRPAAGATSPGPCSAADDVDAVFNAWVAHLTATK